MNKNTLQSTNNLVKVWKSWAAQKDYDESIKKYESEALNKIFEQFYETVRKMDRNDYQSDSQCVMVAGIDGYLAENECKYSIIRDREFIRSKEVLETKSRPVAAPPPPPRKNLLLEVIDVSLHVQPPKTFCLVVLLKYVHSVHFICVVSNPSSQVWYKRQPMGVNKLNDMMKANNQSNCYPKVAAPSACY